MGSHSGEQGRSVDECPQHQVMISRPFYIGAYEVPEAQWQAVMKTRTFGFGYNLDYPICNVNWDDCQEFIQRLNMMGIGEYWLPTEAEWEYACRAGSTTRFPWGDDPNYKLIGEYAWFGSNSGGE